MLHRYDPATDTGAQRADRPTCRSRAALRRQRGADASARGRAGRVVHLPFRACPRVPRPRRTRRRHVSLRTRSGRATVCTAQETWCASAAPGTLDYLGRIDRQLKVSGDARRTGRDRGRAPSPRRHRGLLRHLARRAARPARLTVRRTAYCARCGCPRTFRTSSSTPTACAASAARSSPIEDRARGYFKSMDDLHARVP